MQGLGNGRMGEESQELMRLKESSMYGISITVSEETNNTFSTTVVISSYEATQRKILF